jgi:uncharacterized protein (TIGR00290 family)
MAGDLEEPGSTESRAIAGDTDSNSMNSRKVLLSWSGGKDSAWALHLLRRDPSVEVVALLTTFNSEFDRVAMHAVRRELMEQQAAAAGLTLWAVPLPWPCSNEQYEKCMRQILDRAISEGVQTVGFGDLFLEDIRAYREAQMAKVNMTPLFPVWGINTSDLAHEMIASGLKARLTCVDPRKLDAGFAGREFDATLLHDLPAGADPCGENGEFHTFVYAGPMFRREIPVETGEVVERDGFVFADLLLAKESAAAR